MPFSVFPIKSENIAGETMWMKIYQSMQSENKPISKVVYTDLINGDGQIIISTKWPLTQGIASGNIELPTNMRRGNTKSDATRAGCKISMPMVSSHAKSQFTVTLRHCLRRKHHLQKSISIFFLKVEI